ncbi:MAG: M14 family zinc carboxypeptidase [Candidatus Cloacimonadia bacterium]
MATGQETLDPYYHTYMEIKDEIDSLQLAYPNLVFVDSIGVTNGAAFQQPLPIWAVKLSDNATVDEDEPAILFVGQCHAEEILGVEITMHMINEILLYQNIPPYSIWLSELEIWFIPTINPEGHQVVMDELDITYRKNKRDNNENGGFDYVPGPGNDIDGVDLNRNYDFNWIHGDTLYAPGGEELYDYYRGPAPFSEGGTQAVRRLAEDQHFLFSINWHSSRSGNFSEKVFYSFEWDGEKRPPDFEVNQMIGETVASLIATEDGTSYYEPSPSRSRNGNAQDWFYSTHGTTQLLIECGTSNIQPDSALIVDTCERCSAGAFWLLNRAIGYQAPSAMLTGHISDSLSGEPLSAELIVEEQTAPYFAPRYSDLLYGRFWRVLLPGTYNLRVRAKGYKEKVIPNIVVNNSCWTELDLALAPLDIVELSGEITSNGNPVPAKIVVSDIINDTIYTDNGAFSGTIFEGERKVVITSEGCVPYLDTLQFTTPDYELCIDLLPATTIFYEDWEDGIEAWQITGDWGIWNDAYEGNYSITDSPNQFYTSNAETSITSSPINLCGTAEDVTLLFWHKYYTEWENDICSVEISENGINWDCLAEFSGMQENWEEVIISLAEWQDKEIYLRFKLASDETLVDPGWTIDKIQIVSSEGNNITNNLPGLPQCILHQNIPNPFRDMTTISFDLASPISQNDVYLKIYNIKGQLIRKFRISNDKYQNNEIVWDGTNALDKRVTAGLYFYTLSVNDVLYHIKKCIFIP